MIFSIVAEWIQSKTLTVQDISCPIKTKRQLKTKGPDWTSPHHGQTPQEWRAPFPCDASSINWMDCLHVVVQWVVTEWRPGGDWVRWECYDNSGLTSPHTTHTRGVPANMSHFSFPNLLHVTWVWSSEDILFFDKIVLLTSSSSLKIHPGICFQPISKSSQLSV